MLLASLLMVFSGLIDLTACCRASVSDLVT